MSTLELNKIAGSILLVLMAIQVIGILGDALVRPGQQGASVEVASSPVKIEEQKPKPVEPVLPLLASADVKKGESITKKCQACHSFEKGGPNKIGPDLYGVVGRPIASHAGFSYSSAMKEFGEKHGKWTYTLLNRLIHDPRQDVPGTKMTFAGLEKVQDRADVIAYLRTLSPNPEPLPTKAEIEAVQKKAEAEKGGEEKGDKAEAEKGGNAAGESGKPAAAPAAGK